MRRFAFIALFILAWGFCVRAEASVPGACRGRPLPDHQTRQVSNIRLECTSSVDHTIRQPQPFSRDDFDEWRNIMVSTGDQVAMQKIRQRQPLIVWKGKIPYETIEKWNWVAWVYGQDISCGTEEKCWTDSNGKEHCETIIKECWHDEPRSEARHCSNEIMDYDAEFIRPTYSEWNPKSPGYYDVIPNKYDLLPGEVEDVQVYNTGAGFFSGEATQLEPEVKIGDAWNEYKAVVEFTRDGRGSKAACRVDSNYRIKVDISTVHRLTGKRTPNAFRMPVDQFGKPEPVLKFIEQANSDGKFEASTPSAIRLIDTSAGLIEAMARQTREFTVQREKAEWEQKVLEDRKADGDEEWAGFFKSTIVRVKLYENVRFGRDIRASHNLYRAGADIASFYDPREEKFEIPLMDNDKDRDLYRMSASILFWNNLDSWVDSSRIKLKPETSYRLMVSMYNEGVPFYKQKDEAWTEDQYFSKPLQIDFGTKDVDERPLWLKALNWHQRFALRKLTGW